MDDEVLIKKIAKGDSKAFESLFQKYKTLVYGFSRRLLVSESLAEDNAQETWMKIVQYAPQYQEQGSFRSWVMTVTKNTALNTLRKRGWEEELSDDSSDQIEDSSLDLVSLMENRETMEKLKRALDDLPERQRIAVMLWMQEEKSYEEIAEDLQVNLNAAKVLLFRAKQGLLKLMKEDL